MGLAVICQPENGIFSSIILFLKVTYTGFVFALKEGKIPSTA